VEERAKDVMGSLVGKPQGKSNFRELNVERKE
jgi:hypothetical protein